MPRNILRIIISAIVWSVSFYALAIQTVPDKKFTIVIDAGHGGKDIGATDNGVMEKNINLKVAKQLESLIKKKMKGVKVIMTRDDDTYLTLQQRADKANKAQGDIFISIHTNSVDKKNRNRKSIAGSSVYTLGLHKDENNLQVARRENSVIEFENNYEQKYSGFDPQRDESYIIFEMAQKKNLSQSIKLAEIIEQELESAGRQNRGVHQAGFWVLWATSMPSVLVELDFICNPESAKYMSSDKGTKELAQAIFKALEKYNSSRNLSLAADVNNEEINEVELTVAKKRKNIKTESGITGSIYSINLGSEGKRKRRSLAAKNISAGISFEYEGLSRPGPDSSSVEEVVEGTILLADASLKDNNTNSSSKNGKSLKNKKGKTPKQEKKEKKENKQKTLSYNAKVNKLITVYKIQLLASSDLLSLSNSRFCGLSPITTFKENNLYKYYYGESTDKGELEQVLLDIRKKIPDAFIVTSTKSVQAN